MDFNSEVVAINCCFRSLKGKASIVNPLNNLYALAYKVQQTFFVPATKKKHKLGEEHDTCLLLKSYYSYGNVFYFIRKDA